MDWWILLKARGAAKRREKDQRDLEEFAERRDRHFDDADVDFRSMVNLRAPKALAGVQHQNIAFTDPDEQSAGSVENNPNAGFSPSRNANFARQTRDRARAMKERERDQKLQSHFEGSGIQGARKFMSDEGVQVRLPIRRVPRPKIGYDSAGALNHPSEAFDPRRVRQMLRSRVKPSPNQLAQLPEGMRSLQQIKDTEEARQKRDEEETERVLQFFR